MANIHPGPVPANPLLRHTLRLQAHFDDLQQVCIEHRIGLEQLDALRRLLDRQTRLVNKSVFSFTPLPAAPIGGVYDAACS